MVTSSHNPGDTFPIGTTTVTYTITDAAGLTASCSFDVTVNDTENPTITCPADITVNNDAGQCDAVVTWTAPTGADNCAGAVVTSSHNPGDTFPIGTTTVTYTITDAAGLTASCSFDVTVNDTENPTIACPGDQNVIFDTNCEFSLQDYTALTSTSDNCDNNITVTQSPEPGALITGVVTVTLTATDDANNSSTCTFDVIPSDNEVPTAQCQYITVVLSATGSYTISASDIDNSSYDNCGVASISVSPDTFDCNDIGDNQVTLTVTDVNGLTSQCTAIVTVQDNTAPNITNCGNITIGPLTLDDVTGEISVTQAQIDAAYTATDACGIASATLSQTTFGCNDIGTNNDVNLTITDINGNSSTCYGITVIIEAPTIDGGTIEGYIDVPNPDPASDIIEYSYCLYDENGNITQQDVVFNLTIDPALNFIGWEVATQDPSTQIWSWTPYSINPSNPLQLILPDIDESLLVRAVIQSGTCIAYSAEAVLIVLPPEEPPIIINVSSDNSCSPPEYTIVAESFFEYYGQFGEGGLFNQANLNNLGWLVDGVAVMSAGGNNTSQSTWREVSQLTPLAGIYHYPQEGSKFGTVYGPTDSALETPIFNTVGMTAAEAQVEFYQAFFLCDGASAVIELSLDGGQNYSETLATYTGTTDTGLEIFRPSGNQNNCDSYKIRQDGYEFVTLDLSSYLGEPNLRLRFSYFGITAGSCNVTVNDVDNVIPNNLPCGTGITKTVSSSWAIDGLRVPYDPIDTELEWTDENGNVVATGETVTVSPVTPGTQEYGVTALVDQCRVAGDEGTEFVTLDYSLAYAGQDFTPTSDTCGQSSIDLKAYDNTIRANENLAYWNNIMPDKPGSPGTPLFTAPPLDDNGTPGDNSDDTYPTNYPGTGMTGSWSWTAVLQECATFTPTFTSNTDPRATFTAPPGVYNLTWTLQNGCSDTVQVTINSCTNLDFDGINDYVTFKNNYNLNSNFSIEAWIKPNAISGTIFSRKDNTVSTAGYDLSLSGGSLVFNFGSGSISTGNIINTSRWFHVAVTFDGSYKLYVDGVLKNTVSGSAPQTTPNNIEAILGAIDQSPQEQPVNYYSGWIDEFRVWNRALNQQHIRQMMNQEIKELGGNVGGEVIPTKIYGVDTNQDGTEEDLLTWAHLDGYYRMAVDCGYLTAYKGVSGRLRNITSQQTENAPIPYTTKQNGDWDNINTWSESVWHIPNSTEHGTKIDWNIVRTAHNISSGDKDITVLGLLVDTNEFSIEDPNTPLNENNEGQMLWVTKYLKLDGKLDLVGESQLVQKRYNTIQFEDSAFDNTSTGYIERDQQGTSNPFNYNYWSSPVAPNNAALDNSNSYSIGSVLRDGTITVQNPINRFIAWTGNYTASASNPAQISNRWLYAYINNPSNDYYSWEYISNTGTIPIGLGFTMKGSGNATANQNYVFLGKPNNGTISSPIGALQQSLVGNPYPSAIDSKEFILDNGPSGTNSITGTLYFWEHYTSNATHITELYEGGYAALNFTGGVGAVQHPDLIISNNGTKIPERYIPVGQGFFVEASTTNAQVTFKNSQRIYKTEAYTTDSYEGSVFIRTSSDNNENATEEITIKRLRLEFISPEGALRPLLLGFVPNGTATDGVDWAYDGKNNDESTISDLSWMISDEKYVIQGVGEFDVTKQYPLGLFLKSKGNINISLTDLENFETPINVFIYDSLLDTYTQINDTDFNLDMDAGDYLNRFYLTFQSETLTVNEDEILDQFLINYLNNSNEIFIKVPNNMTVKQVFLIQILGQTVNSWEITDAHAYLSLPVIRIPVKGITEGTYIVKIVTKDNKAINKKVIIMQN
ncbi:hypothetical protein D778_00848 [Xanthomarina gelatinilytica]|uniref:HYR domain-containing protein n=1 Tax=Xanthomarina gelatinilytica TaxID=1137281 RepID=M7MGV2_9FLAO|nr:hypothetical protein D778_00848 [Xanthomarina gelatinilytica]